MYLFPRSPVPAFPSFRYLIRPRNLRLSLDLFHPLLEGRLLPAGDEHSADLVARLLEGRRLRGPALEDLDEVIPVLCLDDVRDLLGLQGERRLLKFTYQLPPVDEPQVASLLAAAGILGVLTRQVVERLAAPELGQYQSRLILVVQENVPDVHLFRPVELAAMLPEVLFDLGVRHGNRRDLYHQIPYGQVGAQAVLQLGQREVALCQCQLEITLRREVSLDLLKLIFDLRFCRQGALAPCFLEHQPLFDELVEHDAGDLRALPGAVPRRGIGPGLFAQ